MTEFTIKPVWYPLGAFIGLAIAVLVVLLLGRSSALFSLLAFTGIGPAPPKRPIPPAAKSPVQYISEEPLHPAAAPIGPSYQGADQTPLPVPMYGGAPYIPQGT